MDCRERILVAMDGGEPDRVPCALSFYHVDLDTLLPPDRYPGMQALLDVNFVSFPLSPEEKKLEHAAGPYNPDTRLGTTAQLSTYARWNYHPETPERSSPLAGAQSLDDLQRFPFPDISTPYLSDELARQVRALHERGMAAGGNLPHLGGELFEAAWRLRGLESFLLDLLRRPDWADYLLDRLAGLARRNAEALAHAGVDVLALDDDVGMPGTMIVGPEMWRRYFKAHLAGIIEAARVIKHDLRVLFHSDGTILPILDDLMEIGVSTINPLQPEHMDAASIRRRYGTRLALWGAVGYQTTFSFETPEQIRLHVAECVATLGRAGLVLCPAYDIDEPDIPAANVVAFLEAVHRYG